MSDDAIKEVEAMFKTFEWTVGMITQSGPEERRHIADAYQEAQKVIADIPKDAGDARPRIMACFERSDSYRAVNDSACVGWVLSAIQERVNEQDLPNWQEFRKLVKMAVKMLQVSRPTYH